MFPKTIAICALLKGCGCSHFTYSLAQYITVKEKKKVYVITNNTEIYEKGEFESGKFPTEFEAYDIVIHDFGCISDTKFETLKEIKSCEKKVMIAVMEEDYLKKLATFIDNDLKFTHSWNFLFNFVPPNKKKELEELMIDYDYGCIPIHEKDDTEKMKEILNEVWK